MDTFTYTHPSSHARIFGSNALGGTYLAARTGKSIWTLTKETSVDGGTAGSAIQTGLFVTHIVRPLAIHACNKEKRAINAASC